MIIKNGRDPGKIRPDITHQVTCPRVGSIISSSLSCRLFTKLLVIFPQCLLMLMDSPLNRAGMLQVYIHTEKNALIEINPQTRIPRTFNRFCGLMGMSASSALCFPCACLVWHFVTKQTSCSLTPILLFAQFSPHFPFPIKCTGMYRETCMVLYCLSCFPCVHCT